MVSPIPKPERVLLVEGVDDKHVVGHLCSRHLCSHFTVGSDVDIKEKQGIDGLLKSLTLEVKAPGLSVLGIITDANHDIASRWQAIADRLHKVGISIPDQPQPDGVVVQDRIRVGVWLMPDNMRKGALEDFILGMIPQDDSVWVLAQKYIESIPASEQPRNIIKAKIHAWLAVRPDGPIRMGTAVKTGDLDARSLEAKKFIEWIERLLVHERLLIQ